MVLKLSKFGERHKPTDWRSWTYCILGGKNGISMYKHITFKWEKKKKSWKQLKKMMPDTGKQQCKRIASWYPLEAWRKWHNFEVLKEKSQVYFLISLFLLFLIFSHFLFFFPLCLLFFSSSAFVHISLFFNLASNFHKHYWAFAPKELANPCSVESVGVSLFFFCYIWVEWESIIVFHSWMNFYIKPCCYLFIRNSVIIMIVHCFWFLIGYNLMVEFHY